MKYKKKKEIFLSMGEPYYRYVKFNGVQFLCYLNFRNPFKKYHNGELVPKIELLPRVSLTFSRVGKSGGVEVGFLNFHFSLLWMNKYKIVTTKVEGKEYNKLKQEYEKQFHVIGFKEPISYIRII